QAQRVNEPPLSPAGRVLLVSGWIDPAGGQAAIRPAFTLHGVAGLPAPGDYTLETLDAAMRVIAAYPLALERAIADPARSGTGFEKTGFHLSLPHIDGIASIRLRRGATILGTLAAGPRAPAVSAGVSTLSHDRRSLRVTWSALDADGDRLHYLARASVDGGATWQTLGANLSSPSIDLRAADFAGRRVLLEVLASDGLHTTALRLGPFDAPGGPVDKPSH
ncbi:MAG TPA: hypothetical protein VJ754_00830, partial [Anaerolineae bacterium]|nr:hypothetical protein [Anaerolineae bacterium]